MNKEELKSFVDNYQNVEDKIKDVFKILQTVDYMYWSIGQGIYSFSVEDNHIHVNYDDSYMGCYDTGYNKFNVKLLFLSDDELVKFAELDKIEREEKHKRREIEIEEQKNIDKEKREREQYEELKNKFEK